MAVLLRSAASGDLDVVCELNRRLARETEGKDLDPAVLRRGVAAVLADPARGRYVVAEEAGAVLGQLALTAEWSDWRAGYFWWLQSVYVRPEARRRGVFRALLGHVERLARQDPEVIGLRLYVETANRAAQETYARLGLRPAGYLVLEKYPL